MDHRTCSADPGTRARVHRPGSRFQRACSTPASMPPFFAPFVTLETNPLARAAVPYRSPCRIRCPRTNPPSAWVTIRCLMRCLRAKPHALPPPFVSPFVTRAQDLLLRPLPFYARSGPWKMCRGPGNMFPWSMGHVPWSMFQVQWSIEHVRWSMEHVRWAKAHVLWIVNRVPWSIAHSRDHKY